MAYLGVRIMVLLLTLNAGAAVGQAPPAERRATYAPSNSLLANPERGFFVQYSARSDGEPLESTRLERLRSRGITLVLRMYYLKAFRDRPLSPRQLELVGEDMNALRRHGLKGILRFSYSSRIGEPDAPLAVVRGHIAQLAPVLREHADVISVVQAGFIGAWGEWHASTNGLESDEAKRAILTDLLAALPPSRCVQVRTPSYKQRALDRTTPLTAAEALGDGSVARVGHHNDCFLADATDVGTYGEESIADEQQYLAHDSQFVPVGGETCRASELAATDNARAQLARFHWSYLNLGFHPAVIERWRAEGFFDEVRRRLGYRLRLEHSACDDAATAGGDLAIELRVHNDGWAAPFNPRDAAIVFRRADDSRESFVAPLVVDPRRWLAGTAHDATAKIDVPADAPAGEYRLSLWLPDPAPALRRRPEYAIQLANEGLWNPATGENELPHRVTIDRR